MPSLALRGRLVAYNRLVQLLTVARLDAKEKCDRLLLALIILTISLTLFPLGWRLNGWIGNAGEHDALALLRLAHGKRLYQGNVQQNVPRGGVRANEQLGPTACLRLLLNVEEANALVDKVALLLVVQFASVFGVKKLRVRKSILRENRTDKTYFFL